MKQKTGPKPKKTETISIRIDPRLKYLAELSARCHRRSLSNFIEWAIDECLEDNIAYASDKLWNIDPNTRLRTLKVEFPELLTFDEESELNKVER